MTQYTSYSTVPTQVQYLVASRCKLLDYYILFQTGDYEYTALIQSAASKKIEKVRIFRTSTSGYNSYWDMDVSEATEFSYTVSNEYYVFSNVGYGQMLDLPVYEAVQAHALTAITVVLFFAIVFKGVLFKCLKRR